MQELTPIAGRMSIEQARDELKHLFGDIAPLDERIAPLVVTLHMFGVRTITSCKGHIGKHRYAKTDAARYPWVLFHPDDFALTSHLVGLQNNEGSRGQPGRRNVWIIFPEPTDRGFPPRLAVVPWNVLRPLAELQADAVAFARFLESLNT